MKTKIRILTSNGPGAFEGDINNFLDRKGIDAIQSIDYFRTPHSAFAVAIRYWEPAIGKKRTARSGGMTDSEPGGKKCTNCNGRGFNMEDTGSRTYDEIPCSDCDGTGKEPL